MWKIFIRCRNGIHHFCVFILQRLTSIGTYVSVREGGKRSPAMFPGRRRHWLIVSQSWPFHGILLYRHLSTFVFGCQVAFLIFRVKIYLWINVFNSVWGFLLNQLFIFVQKEGSLGSSMDPIAIIFPWLLNTYFPNSVFPWALVRLG